MGVRVGVGVMEGVINETRVGVAGSVIVGRRVTVGVSEGPGSVGVHVEGGWIWVMVGVGGWLRAGFKKLNPAFGFAKTAAKYAPMHKVNNRVRMLSMSQRSIRAGSRSGGASS